MPQLKTSVTWCIITSTFIAICRDSLAIRLDTELTTEILRSTDPAYLRGGTETIMAGLPAPAGVTLRRATVDDVPAMLQLMDTAIAWLTTQGRTGQWGDGKQPSSSIPARVDQFTDFARCPGCWVAVSTTTPTTAGTEGGAGAGTGTGAGSVVVGALCVNDTAPDYVRQADGPEMYVRLLITDRAWKGRSLGNFLVATARQLALEAGVPLLRVDCYAGGDGKLVRWYESAGFEKVESFLAKEGTWPGQVLVMRLDGTGRSGGWGREEARAVNPSASVQIESKSQPTVGDAVN